MPGKYSHLARQHELPAKATDVVLATQPISSPARAYAKPTRQLRPESCSTTALWKGESFWKQIFGKCALFATCRPPAATQQQLGRVSCRHVAFLGCVVAVRLFLDLLSHHGATLSLLCFTFPCCFALKVTYWTLANRFAPHLNVPIAINAALSAEASPYSPRQRPQLPHPSLFKQRCFSFQSDIS